MRKSPGIKNVEKGACSSAEMGIPSGFIGFRTAALPPATAPIPIKICKPVKKRVIMYHLIMVY
jgi:hypothetical protein